TYISPCPFCNAKPYTIGRAAYWVECGHCGARGPMGGTEADAIQSWNRVARAVEINKELVDVLTELQACGSFYTSAIELDWPEGPDGITIGARIAAVLAKAKGGES